MHACKHEQMQAIKLNHAIRWHARLRVRERSMSAYTHGMHWVLCDAASDPAYCGICAHDPYPLSPIELH